MALAGISFNMKMARITPSNIHTFHKHPTLECYRYVRGSCTNIMYVHRLIIKQMGFFGINTIHLYIYITLMSFCVTYYIQYGICYNQYYVMLKLNCSFTFFAKSATSFMTSIGAFNWLRTKSTIASTDL